MMGELYENRVAMSPDLGSVWLRRQTGDDGPWTVVDGNPEAVEFVRVCEGAIVPEPTA